MSELEQQAREIVNRHLEYMDGLARGQVTMRVSNAIAAVKEALAMQSQAPNGEAVERVELIEALTNMAHSMKYGPDQAWIEEAIAALTAMPAVDGEVERLTNELNALKDAAIGRLPATPEVEL